MKPSLKLWRDVVADDYAKHPAWTNWYAPDEMELLTQIGFNEKETKAVLETVGWSEEYAFPLPESGASLPFMRLRVSAKVTTSGGAELIGYMSSHSVAVFFQGTAYTFNKALKSLSQKQAEILGSALGEQLIFPLSVELPALHEERSFSLA